MRIKEYLEKNNVNRERFSRAAGISIRQLTNILNGCDTTLSVAISIEEITLGTVTCQDLAIERKEKKKD